jgi:glycine dehydrogenase
MIAGLETWLKAITGFDAICMQPNSGAQGEYAGLVAIAPLPRQPRRGARNVCLIPKSAHGTNPATAQMCGMEVVVVDCDDSGNVDVADLKAKAAQHAANLACLMITYPSTHGVFEEAVRTSAPSCTHGGQVYMDGANLNAQVGLTSPGRHRRRRQPHEPAQDLLHPARRRRTGHGPDRPQGPSGALHGQPRGAADPGPHAGQGAVSAAPWGSASILPISWMYIAMMGGAASRAPPKSPSSTPTTSPAASRTTTRCSTPAARAASPTSASSTCARSRRPPAWPRSTSPSA